MVEKRTLHKVNLKIKCRREGRDGNNSREISLSRCFTDKFKPGESIERA